MALIDKLTNIADAIRGKTGGTEEMTLEQMAMAITGIETGGSVAMDWKKVASYTPASASYLTSMLFDAKSLAIKASYSSGVIISYGNHDTTTTQGNFMGVFIYTPTEIQCFVQGSYNGSIGQYGGLKYARTEQGVGGLFGSKNVGNVRNGYVIVGATYNVYECAIPDAFAEKLMAYTEESAT